ncbi:homing endonuclease [Tuber brumale]|nr:homing endonuclease [Tuber brumale]
MLQGLRMQNHLLWFIFQKNKNCKTGWRVKVEFGINLHIKDKALLKQIQSFFGGIGKIYESSESCQFRVFIPKDLTNVIIPHFDKYYLLTQKRADFELFKMIVELINQKEHLTVEGLNKILSIKASINKVYLKS